MQHNVSEIAPTQSIDAVIVGAGQAGICSSYFLQMQGVPHVVLERDRAFAAWHQRWENFQANTPNWMNTLPMLTGGAVPGDDRKAFATREELIAYFSRCATAFAPPLVENVKVGSIAQLPDGGWRVTTDGTNYTANQVIVCTGAMAKPRLPRCAEGIATPQLHSSHYRGPAQIRTGSVLVVGSGSSGMQICHLLAKSGRFDRVHLSVSNVLVLPERVLGIQIHRLLHRMGMFDIRTTSRLGRLMYSNLETRGDPIRRPTPKDLAGEHGVSLHGRLTGQDGALLTFDDGDAIAASHITIVWCTGFQPDYSFIEVAERENVFDRLGFPIHARGVATHAPGLNFVGLRYQHTVASHDIYGVGEDARFIAGRIAEDARVRAKSYAA